MHPRPPYVPTLSHVLGALAGVVAVLVFAVARFAAPATTASAVDPARTKATLAHLLGDGAPHPVGSPGHGKVRERLLAAWRELGLEPEVQAGWSAGASRFVHVQNVLAVLPGTTGKDGPLLLVAAHYDSVPAGPGACDDMLGVAVQLELARVLKADPAPRPAILFLSTDGEELGLQGARLFSGRHPLRERVAAVVNLEARGTSGPSLLFETAGPVGGALMRWAERAARPLTTSLFVRAYEQMPNDTDFTVFRRELNVSGFNFACIGSVQHYHTPLDSLANVDEHTLLHQLDNALAAVRSLSELPKSAASAPRDDGLWCDIAGYGVVVVTRHQGELLGILAVALTLGGVVSRIRRGRVRLAAALLGFALTLGVIVVASALGFLVHRGLAASGSIPERFVASLRPIQACGLLLAIGTTLLAGALGALRAGFAGLALGVQLAWSVLLAVAMLLERFVALPMRGTELLPVLVPPMLAMGTFGMASAVVPRVGAFAHLAVLVPALLAMLFLGPTTWILLEGLGVAWFPAQVGLFALGFSLLAPYASLVGPRRYVAPLVAFLLALGAAVAALKLAPFTPLLPRGANVVLAQDDGKTKWTGAYLPKPAPPEIAAEFPEPELTVLEDVADGPGRILTVRLRSARGAQRMVLRFEEALCEDARIAGDDFAVLKQPLRGFGVTPVPREGVVVRFRLPLAVPVAAVVEDVTYDLPAAGVSVRAARPPSAVPIQDGDRTIVRRPVTF